MIGIGREMLAVVGGVLRGSLPDAKGGLFPGDKGNLSFREEEERLALRPRDAKKPAPFVDGAEASERTEGGVPIVTLEFDRVGWAVRGGLMARDGYGRLGGSPGGVISL